MRRRMADAATARLPDTATQAEPSRVEPSGASSARTAARQRPRTGVDPHDDDELFKSPARRLRDESPQKLTAAGVEQQVWEKKGEGQQGAVADLHKSGFAGEGTSSSSPHLKQSDAGASLAVVLVSSSAAAIPAPVSCPSCCQIWHMISNEDLNRHLDTCLDSAMIVLD